MLLRNLDVSMGLCNGTRLILLEARSHVLRCRIISGDAKFAGNVVLIPRITLEPSAQNLPLPLRRHQFPVRLAFAMTINKSQGQSVSHVGLDLQTPVFSHGQLYVALSRCTSASRIKVLLNANNVGNRTANIVYKEILNGVV
jgi:ATP-dependent DNA helicase PIF1